MRAGPTGGGEGDASEERDSDDAIGPPPFGTWSTLYAAVLLFLAFLIALFYWLTRAFSR